jgi:hypothetical protein
VLAQSRPPAGTPPDERLREEAKREPVKVADTDSKGVDMTTKTRAVAACAFVAGVLSGCASPTPAPLPPVCVDFDPPQFLAGMQYRPGGPVVSANNIRMTVQPLRLPNGTSVAEVARVEQPRVFFGTGQALRTDNITVEFDFSGLPTAPSQVSLAYLDLGGVENVAVNGSTVFAGQLPTTPNPIGGAGVRVTSSAVTGGTTGTVSFRGPIKTLRIGGQEFWIDQVCAR